VRALCAEIARLPSAPLVFIDQEGGLVRRLKETRGFAPLPAAKDFNHLPDEEKRKIFAASIQELRALGIRYKFAPVIDVDYNPDNPNIGRIKRSFSGDIGEVEANARLMSEVAREAHVGLCLKHFPGIGGADVDSHQDFMDISDALRPEQEALSIRWHQKPSAMPCWSAMPSSGNGIATIRRRFLPRRLDGSAPACRRRC
jgi:beta-N-acetylhexosaminidase